MNDLFAAVALSWLVCASALGVEISTIETDVGVYEVVRLPRQIHGFELTDSRDIGVEAQANPAGQRTFRAFSTADATSSRSERSIGEVHEWAVMGDRLVVASGGKLETFSLPALEPVASLALTDKAAAPDNASKNPEVRLTLAASVNAGQDVLIVTDAEKLQGRSLPLHIRVADEEMYVTQVDDFRGQLRVARSRGAPHSVTDEVVTIEQTDDAAVATIRRVAGGWYCDGYVFDRSGTHIESAFYFRHASPKAEWREQIVSENLQLANRGQARVSSNERSISAALETVPADIVVFNSPTAVTIQIRGYDGGFVSGGIHDQFVIDQRPATGGSSNPSALPGPTDLRVDGRDITFVVGDTGYHLRVQQFDAFSSDIPAPQRFAFKQPAMLLDDLVTIPQYEFLDGPDPHPARTHSCIHDHADSRDKLEEEARLFLLERFNGRGASIAEFESRLNAYRSEVSGEFERTAGRQPQGVPIPYRVEAETRWEVNGIARDKLRYCVWKEWPEQELVQLLFEDVLEESQRQELERRRGEILAEKERERLRVIEEQEQRRLAVEREHKERQHAVLAESLATRFRIASGLCVGGIACFFVLRVRSRKGATV